MRGVTAAEKGGLTSFGVSAAFGGRHGSLQGTYNIWRGLYLIPNFFIRPRRVLGFRFKIRAAPFGPSISPSVFPSTRGYGASRLLGGKSGTGSRNGGTASGKTFKR